MRKLGTDYAGCGSRLSEGQLLVLSRFYSFFLWPRGRSLLCSFNCSDCLLLQSLSGHHSSGCLWWLARGGGTRKAYVLGSSWGRVCRARRKDGWRGGRAHKHIMRNSGGVGCQIYRCLGGLSLLALEYWWKLPTVSSTDPIMLISGAMGAWMNLFLLFHFDLTHLHIIWRLGEAWWSI